MDDLDVDALLDEADSMEQQRRERMKYLDNPRYASGNDFENPFYVIVHANQIDVEMDAENLLRDIGSKVKAEIDEIKSRYLNSWTEAGPHYIATGIPSDRPILVCGAFEEFCVSLQYEKLLKAGHNAYISREGVLFFSSLK